jgi:hypothetical protein
MPVILPPEQYDLWLDPRCQDTEKVAKLAKPADLEVGRHPVKGQGNRTGVRDKTAWAVYSSARWRSGSRFTRPWLVLHSTMKSRTSYLD